MSFVDTKSGVDEGRVLCDGSVIGRRDGMQEWFGRFAREEAEQQASVWCDASNESSNAVEQ